MKELLKELKQSDIHWITPETEDVFAEGQLDQVFDSLNRIALKNKKENFNMMPKIVDIELVTGEVVEAVANANFKQGTVELIGIFIYDYTKNSYENVKSILQRHFNVQFYN